MNRFLAIFGLMRIKRAEQLTLRVYQYYVACVLNSIEKDFGVPSIENYHNNAEIWWRLHFIRAVAKNTNDIKVETNPQFSSQR